MFLSFKLKCSFNKLIRTKVLFYIHQLWMENSFCPHKEILCKVIGATQTTCVFLSSFSILLIAVCYHVFHYFDGIRTRRQKYGPATVLDKFGTEKSSRSNLNLMDKWMLRRQTKKRKTGRWLNGCSTSELLMKSDHYHRERSLFGQALQLTWVLDWGT